MVDIRITDDDVREWQVRKLELEIELGDLTRKLELVSLMGHKNGSAGEQDLPAINSSREAPTTKAAILLSILEEKNRFMSPQEIKDSLIERGESEDKWGLKYIYVHQYLKRFKDKGTIIRGQTNKKYRITPPLPNKTEALDF